MPASLTPGQSWSNPNALMVRDGKVFKGSQHFTVISVETVQVPFGVIEAFKVTYSGAYTENEGFMPDGISTAGTVWVHPEIGVVKAAENSAKVSSGLTYYFYYTSELVATNF